VTALTPDEENDGLTRWSPFSAKMHGILDTFPPGIATTA
jgi:hypothetical protein